MNVLRKLGLALLATILLFALLGAAWSHVGRSTIGNRDTVKGWLDDSKFYDRVVTVALDQVNKESADSGEQQIPVDDPQIQLIISSAFSPDYLRENVEKVLDGTFAWLEGDTDKPEFTIDLADAKQRLADGMSNYATTKAAGLPACTPAQTAELASSGGFDVLSAPCLPPGTDASAAIAGLRNQVLSNEDFLGDTTFTGDDIKVKDGDDGNMFSSGSGEEVTLDQSDEFKRIQSAYKAAGMAPYVLGTIAALTAAGIVFLSATKRKGFTRAGVVTLVSGILLGISYTVFSGGSMWLNDFLTTDITTGQKTDPSELSATSKSLINDLVQAIYNDVGRLLLWYAIGFAAVGIIMIVLAHVIGKPKAPELKQSTAPEPPIDDSPKADPAKTRRADKPATTERPAKKPPTKIQL